MNKKVLFGGALIIAVIIGGWAAWKTVPERPSTTNDTSQSPRLEPDSDSEEGSLDPFSIEALRRQNYNGGEIKIEQDLGNQNGFRSAIVSYTSDGLTLRALMNTPAGQKPESGWPVVILNHGYIPPAEYNTVTSYKAFGDYFARQGYLVFKPDYRGHAQSEGSAETANTAPYYVQDVLHLLAAVKKYPDADKGRIAMLGHSMGGGITLRAILVDKDIRASVIVAGVVASSEEIWRLGKEIDNPAVPDYIKVASPVLEARYGMPENNSEAWRALDPYRYLNEIRGSVQLHHGTNDKDVPKSFSDTLHARLQEASKQVEYFEYPGGDHNLAGKDRAPFLQRTVDFLRRELN